MKLSFFKTISIIILALASGSICLAQKPLYPQGKRFPLGVYSLDTTHLLTEYGWNMAQSYHDEVNLPEFIQRAGNNGFLTLSSTAGIKDSKSEISNQISASQPGSKVAWWDLPEEVKWYEKKDFKKLQNLAALTRENDPLNHPLYLYLAGDFGVEDVKHYVPFVDIITASCYSNFKSKPHAFNRWILESRIEAIQQAGFSIGPDYLKGEKTVCAVLELFDFTDSKEVLSKPQQAYHDFWLALASGAQGIMVYSYAHKNSNPNLPKYWLEYAKAASRLTGHEQLDQMILFGNENKSISAKVTQGPQRTPKFSPRVNELSPTPPANEEMDYPSIKTLAKSWNENLYIIAVNSAIAGISSEISGLPKDISFVEVLYENRKVAVTNGKINDKFDAYEVHIYKIAAKRKLAGPGPIIFSDVTVSAGLNEALKGVNGHTVAWGDVNNDGYHDLFIGVFANHKDSEYARRGHGAYHEPDKLLLSADNGTKFIELTPSPIQMAGRSSGAVFADFDNDGYLDLVSTHIAYPNNNSIYKQPNGLFKNDGTGRMIDVSANSKLIFNIDTVTVSARNTFVLDYDGDGMIDLLMQDDDVWPWSYGQTRLMRNTGNMVFEDVTTSAGLPEGLDGLGGWCADINDDSWPDFYFAHSNVMYINNADGTFRKSDQVFFNPEYSKSVREGNEIWTCGGNVGDLNGDGLLDMVIGDHFQHTLPHRISVFLNKGIDKNGEPQFENITDKLGIDTITQKEAHLDIEDYDNDGDMDLLVSTREYFMYTNLGNDVNGLPILSKPSGSNAPEGGLEYWPAGTSVDFDRDGRMDYFGVQWYADIRSPLLRNVTEGADEYIGIAVNIPSNKNRNAIGATIRIYKPGQMGNKDALLGIKSIAIANGYSSGSPAEVHFGTPGLTEVDIEITFPCDGGVCEIPRVPTNQLFTLKNLDK